MNCLAVREHPEALLLGKHEATLRGQERGAPYEAAGVNDVADQLVVVSAQLVQRVGQLYLLWSSASLSARSTSCGASLAHGWANPWHSWRCCCACVLSPAAVHGYQVANSASTSAPNRWVFVPSVVDWRQDVGIVPRRRDVLLELALQCLPRHTRVA